MNKKKILLKTISWRIIAIAITFSITLVITGNYALATFIGGFDVVIKTCVYYFHEILWERYK